MMNEPRRDAWVPPPIHVGRVAGIPIGLHYSWFIIAGLITLSLATHFRVTQPAWPWTIVLAAATGTAVLFFLTLLIHELSHAWVARSRGLEVDSITLFALGGIARIDKAANTPTTDLLVAITGPIVSFAIGVGAIAAAGWLGWSPLQGTGGVIGRMLGWLGFLNLLLAAFNAIPGYPLDGGRVLRAILWSAYRDEAQATRHAARVGQVVASLLIALGIFQFFVGAGFGGLWLVLTGWFLLLGAQATAGQVSMCQTLRGVRVSDIMGNDWATVEAGTNLRSLVDDFMLRTGRRCVVVYSDSRMLGLVTPREIRGLDRRRWLELTAADVMRPLAQLRTVTPGTTVDKAFTTMVHADVNQLPVVTNGHLEGVISRGDILRLLQARSDLSA